MSLIKIREFRSDHDENEVHYPEQYQRRLNWPAYLTSSFVESICKDIACLTTIVLADVRKCLKHSRANGDRLSAKYFHGLLNKGYRYLSLDGMNRSKKLIEFLNNKTPITGNFIDADGKTVPVVNKFFKDLPQRLQDRILDSHLNVEIAPPCSKSELSDIFMALNSGQPLNSHEKRQSQQTPIADWVRKTRKNLNDAIIRVTKGKADHDRMLDDELVAKMTMSLMKNNPSGKSTGDWGLSSEDIDRFYEMGTAFESIVDPGCPYSIDEITRVEQILDMWRHTLLKQKNYTPSKTVPSKMSWAVLYACEWAYDSGYDIHSKSYALFFKNLKELDDSLISSSETEYTRQRTSHIDEGRDPDEVSKKKFYFSWSNLPHQIAYRKNRIKSLTTAIKKGPTSFGLVRVAIAAAK